MADSDVEGWDLNDSTSSDEDGSQTAFSFLMKPINFLGQSYPLEPDMIFGWRPKLPLSPVPLTYKNTYVDWLVSHIHSDARYKLIYLGNRSPNSVKVNQMYDYSWKSRNKYNLNVEILKQKIETVGYTFQRRLVGHISTSYKFNSSFEGGNLDAVVEIKPNEFDCFIRSDSNTRGHCNWFHFSVTNMTGGSVRFNICNITKHANLYVKGMKPYVNDGYGWKQAGEDVAFVEVPCRYGFDIKQYQLQFTYNFRLPDQKVEFAYGIPYSYSRLEAFINELKLKHPDKVESQSLGDSLGGVSIPLLTITNNIKTYQQQRRLILVTARIHPGESISSHMLQGFIRSLLDKPQFASLLQEFEFKIVPMLNPDGVIIGNFRTSYSGRDLNRQFFTDNKLVYPEICSLNQLATSLKKQYQSRFEYYFDLHGHSTKANLFCYGPEYPRWSSYYLKCRAFAKIMEQSDQMFSYKNSIFTISEHKRTTGRAKMFTQLQIPYTYTFELSNGFYESTQKKLVALDEADMHRAGRIILEGFSSFQKVQKTSLKILHASNNNQKSEAFFTAAASKRSSMKVISKINTSVSNRTQQNISSENRLRSGKKHKMLSSQPDMKNITNEAKLFQQPEKLKLIHTQQRNFEQILNQIRVEKIDTIIDGGSDSEPDAEDLDRDEINLLHHQLEHRELGYVRTSVKEEPKQIKRRQRKSLNKQSVSRKFTQPDTQGTRNALRQVNRSETARVPRRLVKKPSQQKYLLAQKSFVMNL